MRNLDHGEKGLRRLGGGNSLNDVGGEIEDGAAGAFNGFAAGCYILRLNLPAGAERFFNENTPFDDKRTFVPTSTAAPQEAPQSLNIWVLERQRRAQASAALADATSLPNDSMSVTARSARILRSTSMPAALSPAMKRL